MVRNLWLWMALVLGLSAVYLGWRWNGAASELAAARSEHEAAVLALQQERHRAEDELLLAKAEVDRLKQELAQAEAQQQKPEVWVSAVGIEALRQKGLKDPLADLHASLQQRTDLIPMPGVLGGTQAFREFSLVANTFVVVTFDDGHIGGVMVLKYTVENGQVTWAPLYWEEF